ncbi:MAG: YdiU family protein [Magnetococcales bacterium]|nr:YdiU family protein [Magnetococcales bacterium]
MNKIGWSFDNTYAQLPEILYTRLAPTPARAPGLVLLNHVLANKLGLDFSDMDEQSCAALFAGNRLPEGAEPIAQAYAGHQFGHFTMLGDGRAIVLGEQVAPDGKRFDIQLKGSGRTPYSRNGDGRAALGPMLREYIISEAMHALGVPTTRALAIATTGEPVHREQPLRGAVLTRVAASHLRVGTFEYAAMRREIQLLQQLTDYACQRHGFESAPKENNALTLLKGVMNRQMDLIIHWMRVGFIHGVMNTDNMAISGETIDYGPCAFMDAYDPGTLFSSIDHAGRYAFAAQPRIAKWNGARFAETLLPLLHNDQDKAIAMAEETINGFGEIFQQRWLEMMRRKLGLIGREDGDAALVDTLLEQMKQQGADYTETFRALTYGNTPSDPLFQDKAFQTWHQQWKDRQARQPGDAKETLAMMRNANPAVIPRNHKVEQALDAAANHNDMKPLQELLAALDRPYEDRPELEPYQSPSAPGERVYQTFCGT